MRLSAARTALPVLLVMILAIVAGACGTSYETPTPAPTPVTSTEMFEGTVTPSAYGFHTFTVSKTGPVTISLTSVGPLSTMALGVGIGAWDGITCGTAVSANTNARAGATALTGTAGAGNYCVRVFDAGNIPVDGSATYTLQVVHP